VIERNCIGLLSNYRRAPLDAPSRTWLGAHYDRERVQTSGLWNNSHVDEDYDPRFLDVLLATLNLDASLDPVSGSDRTYAQPRALVRA
jgi:hypothetical protein